MSMKGNYVEDRRSGKGKMTSFASGVVKEGDWLNDKFKK